MKFIDILLILILAVICGLIIYRMIKQKKAGKSCSCGCGGNCSGCSIKSEEKKEIK
ncbi:MAG: FeoB-associated Cys-rich membrane protein [Treponema sp.]|nr:FeoB-associated Cys-rich membrane protein [Treponema sp.]